MFVFSRILADFFSLRDNSANRNISPIFLPAIHTVFRLQIGGLWNGNRRLYASYRTVTYLMTLNDP